METIPKINGNVARRVDAEWRRGNSLNFYIDYFEDTEETIPMNLAASTFRMDLVDKRTGKPPVLSFTLGSGLTISNTNRLTFTKTAAQMLVKAGKYSYDLERTTGAEVLDIQYGQFEIIDDDTK